MASETSSTAALPHPQLGNLPESVQEEFLAHAQDRSVPLSSEAQSIVDNLYQWALQGTTAVIHVAPPSQSVGVFRACQEEAVKELENQGKYAEALADMEANPHKSQVEIAHEHHLTAGAVSNLAHGKVSERMDGREGHPTTFRQVEEAAVALTAIRLSRMENRPISYKFLSELGQLFWKVFCGDRHNEPHQPKFHKNWVRGMFKRHPQLHMLAYHKESLEVKVLDMLRIEKSLEGLSEILKPMTDPNGFLDGNFVFVQHDVDVSLDLAGQMVHSVDVTENRFLPQSCSLFCSLNGDLICSPFTVGLVDAPGPRSRVIYDIQGKVSSVTPAHDTTPHSSWFMCIEDFVKNLECRYGTLEQRGGRVIALIVRTSLKHDDQETINFAKSRGVAVIELPSYMAPLGHLGVHSTLPVAAKTSMLMRLSYLEEDIAKQVTQQAVRQAAQEMGWEFHDSLPNLVRLTSKSIKAAVDKMDLIPSMHGNEEDSFHFTEYHEAFIRQRDDFKRQHGDTESNMPTYLQSEVEFQRMAIIGSFLRESALLHAEEKVAKRIEADAEAALEKSPKKIRMSPASENKHENVTLNE